MTEATSPIIFSYELPHDGRGIPLTGSDITDKLEATDLAWVHLDASNPQAPAWLQENVPYLDNHMLGALFAEETRPRILEHEDGILLILRGVNLNENADPEDMISIRLWIDPHRIISAQKRPLKATQDIRQALEDGKGPKDAGDFIGMLAARLFERMQPVLIELDDQCDKIEEELLEDANNSYRREIIDVRKKAIMLRRYIAPQRDAMFMLSSSEMPWLTRHHKRHLHESLDRATRYIEDLDALRERAQIIKDELSSILADKMNKNMYVLSVVAAIFLPLGFFTGLLGINVGGMPGAEYDMAFWFVCLICVGVSLGLTGLFKIMRWI